MSLGRLGFLVAFCSVSAMGARLEANSRGGDLVLAHPEVFAVRRDGNWRAILGMNQQRGVWLAVERFDGSDRTWINDLRWGQWQIKLTQLVNVFLNDFSGGIAKIRGRYQQDWIDCIIDTRSVPWTTSCSGQYSGGVIPGTLPSPPPPPSPSMADIQAVTNRCADAFSFSDERSRCVNHLTTVLRGRFAQAAVGIPAACANVFSFASERLTCISHTRSAKREPTSVIAYCGNNFSFTNDRFACLAKWMAEP